MKRIAVACFTLCLFLTELPALHAQGISFKQAKQDIIESRLRDCPEKNTARVEKLKELFRAVGCSGDQLTEQAVKDLREPNVICTLPGQTQSTIIVGAHFDNDGSGHGVIDNWSGASLLPTLYESVKASPRKHTFVFIGFAGEEQGLVGSEFYAKHMSREQVKQTSAMVNIDCLALAPTAVALNESDAKLVEMLKRMAAFMKVPLHAINTGRVGLTDVESFGRHKNIAKLSLHSITQLTLKDINSTGDNWNAVQWKDYYDSYMLIAGFLVYGDAKLD